MAGEPQSYKMLSEHIKECQENLKEFGDMPVCIYEGYHDPIMCKPYLQVVQKDDQGTQVSHIVINSDGKELKGIFDNGDEEEEEDPEA